MEDQTKHYLISGLVQGVGFRRFVERTAKSMQVRGWVRNLRDGRVEAFAQAPSATLAQFAHQLQSGPAHSRVDSVLSTEPLPATECIGFVIKPDGDRPCTEN